MSLLNDALRAAEDRQKRPQVSSSYTGSYGADRPAGQRWLLVLLVVLTLAIVALGGYWLLTASGRGSAPLTAQEERSTPLESAASGNVQRPSLARGEPAQPVEPPSQTTRDAPESAAEMSGDSDTQVSGQSVDRTPAPTPDNRPEPASVSRPDSSASTQALTPRAEPTPIRERETAPVPESETVANAPNPVVKRSVQTPEAVDRQQAKQLEALLAEGRFVEAERQLAQLVGQQAAPRSRYVVARALLVDGEASRALGWLPETVAFQDAEIRMLRARALHQQQRLDQAVALLQTDVPPVADGVEYRTTLATLLQQQGQVKEAARQWAELIAWDDSRAPWWVGLAIALEDQGELRSATRAYEQAVSLPGLSSSLVDYVQQRLRSLRAG